MLLEGTRYNEHIGKFNNVVNEVASKQGAIDGSVGGSNHNIHRDSQSNGSVAKTGQVGGAYYGITDSNVHAGGPTGGLMHIQKSTNCGMNSDLNLNASKQYSGLQNGGGSGYGYVSEGNARYGFDSVDGNVGDFRGSYAPITSKPISSCMTGGFKLCHDIRKIKHFHQVLAFWSAICPGAVKLYKEYLVKLEKQHSEKVLAVVKEYTRAFCSEVRALKSKNKKVIKKELHELKTSMKKVEKILIKLAPSSKKLHKMVERMHIGRIQRHLNTHHKTTHKQEKKHYRKTHKKTNKHHKKTHKKGHKKQRKYHKKTMKGGYNQFGSNIPYTPSYAVSTNGGYEMGTPGATMLKNSVNCVDNYNHYTGKGAETGVYDGDVKM